MRANIIDKAKSIIENRRQEADSIAYNNKIIAMQDSVFKSLYTSYMEKMIEDAKHGVDDPEGLNNLKEKCNKRLAQLGITSIEPSFSCKKCNDKGVINGKYCDCLIDEVNKILIINSLQKSVHLWYNNRILRWNRRADTVILLAKTRGPL